MTILVTGDRNWTDKQLILDTIKRYSDVEVLIHGNARGADRLAGEVARELHIREIKMPADWNTYGKAAGPIRNREMAALKPDMVLAFHDDLSNSRGTRDMVEVAEAKGIPVIKVKHEN